MERKMASVFGASSSLLFSKQQAWGAQGIWAAAWKNRFTVMNIGDGRGEKTAGERSKNTNGFTSTLLGKKEEEPLWQSRV